MQISVKSSVTAERKLPLFVKAKMNWYRVGPACHLDGTQDGTNKIEHMCIHSLAFKG